MKKIGIIGAMEEEIISFKRKVIVQQTIEKAGMTFLRGHVDEIDVILVKTELGTVSAALCTQILIDLFEVEVIIQTGLAGGLHPSLSIGDMVIATDVKVYENKEQFTEGNQMLLQTAQQVAREVLDTQQIVIGSIESEDSFEGCIKVPGECDSTFVTYFAEIEAAAVAHTCFLNNVPFVELRTISDTAGKATDMNFEEFVHLITRNISKIVNKMIEINL
ncbi:MAG: 5'-methylthioadenosine/S-adenosylhomocysteine nucleosidase [Cellulosilyticaceae bacterium]